MPEPDTLGCGGAPMSAHKVQRIATKDDPAPPFEWPWGSVSDWTWDWGRYLRLLADGQVVLALDTHTRELQAVQGSWYLPDWLVAAIQTAIEEHVR